MNKRIRFYLLLALVIPLPFWMWLAWMLTPERQLVAAIIDKTVLRPDGQEHISLMWILNHQRFTKTGSQPYNTDQDYFGFFPLKNQQYRLKGLERFSQRQLTQLSRDCDLTYYADTYGIYQKEWWQGKNAADRSGLVYGGMSQQDVDFLGSMKRSHKLVIVEFNNISSPTQPGVREQFQSTFGVHWTGWVGRFFDSLDTTVNQEIPHWLVDNYKQQHRNKWSFTKPGIVFVSEGGTIVILEKDTHLTKKSPFLFSCPLSESRFRLPAKIRYTYWFDILTYNPAVNRAIATYEVFPNDAGKKELDRYGLPLKFPAVLMHDNSDYTFYYFAGDFCDNPITLSTAYLRGVEWLSPLFYMTDGYTERREFFWRVYQPMVTRILENYYDRRRRPNTLPAQ